MPRSSKEAQIVLAIQAIKSNPNLSVRKAAEIYGVERTTLKRRINGNTPRQEYRPTNYKLSLAEEETIVQYILELDSKGFAPRLSVVEDMANSILCTRGNQRVGKNWVNRFTKRRQELKNRMTRHRDYQRALCEDPRVIREWFDLFKEVKEKHGIQDDDIWNFDETGFALGLITSHMVVTKADRVGRATTIQPGDREWASAIICFSAGGEVLPPFILLKGVIAYSSWLTESNYPPTWPIKPTENGWTDNETGIDWIKHFDKYSFSRTKGQYRLLILDGHESHNTFLFHEYCREHNIVVLCLPPHSSHLLQPADVGAFEPLKKAYGFQINDFIKACITHITKLEFLIAFQGAFKAAITEKNAKAGFRGSGLVPYNPEAVIEKMDVHLRTPSPTSALSTPWTSQTPTNAVEALNQVRLVQKRLDRHQSSSPTPIFDIIRSLVKGTEILANKVTLLSTDNQRLRTANHELSRRRRAPRVELGRREAITAENNLTEEVVEEIALLNAVEKGNVSPESSTQSRCGICRGAGHNKRTCPLRSIDPTVLNST